MIQPKKGICSECGTEQYLVNQTRKLCLKHNDMRLEPGRKKRKRIPYKRKVTGEGDLFKQIWDSRPHYCVNCKEYLGAEARSFYFSHIKSKGAYPELRLNPDNITLLCFRCHRIFDQGTKEEFKSAEK